MRRDDHATDCTGALHALLPDWTRERIQLLDEVLTSIVRDAIATYDRMTAEDEQTAVIPD